MTHPTRLASLLTATRPWLADGGLETAMIYHEGLDLPFFAAFPLLERDDGRAALGRYFTRHIAEASRAGTGFMLDTPTWRANMGWAGPMGLDEAAIRRANRAGAAFAAALRARHEDAALPIVINGAIGPAGDGYRVDTALTPEAAAALHEPQVQALAGEGVDLVTATTMTHAGEAIGIVRAARAAGVPVAVSFTVETDGRLASGQRLEEAIAEVDDATGSAALYFMVNCAHPDHFREALAAGAPWLSRIGGIRANASRLSHAELDAATELDDGDPAEFGALYAGLLARLPALKVLGGCCGTDHRHIGAVGAACLHHRHAA